jgi:hypothetical protein
VYWKGTKPSELLDYDSRFVAFMQELPFQEGKPLSSISKEGDDSTELLEYSHRLTTRRIVKSTWLPFAMRTTMSRVPSTTTNYSRTCLATSVRRTPPQDEDEEHRRIRRLKNAKRA